MESETEQIDSYINEMKLKRLKIILNIKFNMNYSKNIYDFFELFKIRVLKQIIYENKYFNSYKKLYSLRNIFIKTSIAKQKSKLEYYSFYYWYIKAKTEKIKINKKYSIKLFQTTKRNNLTKIVLKKILKEQKADINIPIIKRYLLLYLKNYNYLTENYYIKSITIVKAIFNYFRKKLKIYKSIFFSRIDYNIQKDDCFYIYKYILTNYINDENNQNDNKRTNAFVLLDNCNSILKLDYNKNIRILSQENISYIMLDKIVINNIFVNKNISKFFSLWKKNALEQGFIYNIQSKEILINDLMYSKILLLVLIFKKHLKKYFDFLCYKIQNIQIKILAGIKLETIYNNILFNFLKGINSVQNFQNLKNWRIYNLNDNTKKIIVLKKWKGQKDIICNYNYSEIILPNNNLKIIKGCHYFDTIFLSHDYKRIFHLIKSMLKSLSYNITFNYTQFKLFLFSQIVQNKIINIKKKIIFRFISDMFKAQNHQRYLISHISFMYSILTNIFSAKIIQYKITFINKFIYYFHYLKNSQLNIIYNKEKENSNIQIINNEKKGKNKINNKLQALNILIRYYQKNHIKNNYLYSLKYCFIHWCSLVGIFPSFLSKPNKLKLSSSLDKEEEEEIKAQKKEILEQKKSLKEDKDFQHDLKAKIAVLDEENNFVNEKIFDITQRVEKCQKCNNLLKTSYISDNLVKTTFDNIVKNAQDEENSAVKSRNIIVGRDATSSSGVNFISGGTELAPRKPRDFSKNGEHSLNESIEMNVENNEKNKGDTEHIKQKILELKREKDPIINKLKEEINELYKELNVD